MCRRSAGAAGRLAPEHGPRRSPARWTGDFTDADGELGQALTITDIAALLLDQDLRIRQFTPACRNLFHLSDEDLGRHVADTRFRIEHRGLIQDCIGVILGQPGIEREIRGQGQDWFIRRTFPYGDGRRRKKGVVVTFTDVSRVKRTETALKSANRGLALLSTCSEYLVRARSEEALLHDICRLIVESGNYRMAWVGYAQDDQDRSVKPVAQHGFGEGYLESMEFSWGRTPTGRGPVGNAIRRGRTSVLNDIRRDPKFLPWRHAAVKLGYESVAALPLSNDREIIGVLTLYSHRPKAFDADELHLLEDLANDLAFGINALRERKIRAKVEAELRTARDILEQRVAQRTAELQQAARRAEAASEAKSEFLSAMSHELRTPLNAILGFGQFLLFDKTNPVSDAQRETIQNIIGAGDHLLHLVNQVLELETASRPDLKLTIADIDPARIIRECADMARVIAEPRAITVEMPQSSRSLPRLRVDESRLKQILLNLLSNAVKFNRDGGWVRISWIEDGQDKLRICVTDSGRGIPSPLEKELFTPFSRLEAKTAKVDGTGIGLAICRDLVEAMQGRIGYEPLPEGGSRFWIQLLRA